MQKQHYIGIGVAVLVALALGTWLMDASLSRTHKALPSTSLLSLNPVPTSAPTILPTASPSPSTVADRAGNYLLLLDRQASKPEPTDTGMGKNIAQPSNTYTISIFAYDVAQKTLLSVKQLNSKSFDLLPVDGQTFDSMGKFYYVADAKLFSTTLGGQTDEIMSFAPMDGGVEVHADGTKISWYHVDETGLKSSLMLLDVASHANQDTLWDPTDPLAQILGFSRDFRSFFYSEGPYEGSDSAPEQTPNAENQYGFHRYDILTHHDQLLDPSNAPDILWDNPAIDAGHSLYFYKQAKSIKRITNANFDYLSLETINALPDAGSFTLPDKYVVSGFVFADGHEGVLYSVSKTIGVTPSELGYYDVEADKNYFPIPNIPFNSSYPNGDFSIVPLAAFSSDNLFYQVNPIRSDKPANVYRTSVTGANELIKSISAGTNSQNP
jgi:hypothetical protein